MFGACVTWQFDDENVLIGPSAFSRHSSIAFRLSGS